MAEQQLPPQQPNPMPDASSAPMPQTREGGIISSIKNLFSKKQPLPQTSAPTLQQAPAPSVDDAAKWHGIQEGLKNEVKQAAAPVIASIPITANNVATNIEGFQSVGSPAKTDTLINPLPAPAPTINNGLSNMFTGDESGPNTTTDRPAEPAPEQATLGPAAVAAAQEHVDTLNQVDVSTLEAAPAATDIPTQPVEAPVTAEINTPAEPVAPPTSSLPTADEVVSEAEKVAQQAPSMIPVEANAAANALNVFPEPQASKMELEEDENDTTLPTRTPRPPLSNLIPNVQPNMAPTTPPLAPAEPQEPAAVASENNSGGTNSGDSNNGNETPTSGTPTV